MTDIQGVTAFLRTRVDLQEDPRLTATWKQTIKVAVSGAAGQISNHLLFMVRSCFVRLTWHVREVYQHQQLQLFPPAAHLLQTSHRIV